MILLWYVLFVSHIWHFFLDNFAIQVLDSNVFAHNQCGSDTLDVNGFEEVDDASVLYCERFMEFLIDLLSQLRTRR